MLNQRDLTEIDINRMVTDVVLYSHGLKDKVLLFDAKTYNWFFGALRYDSDPNLIVILSEKHLDFMGKYPWYKLFDMYKGIIMYQLLSNKVRFQFCAKEGLEPFLNQEKLVSNLEEKQEYNHD